MEEEAIFPTEFLWEIFSQLICVKMGIIMIEDDSLLVDDGRMFFCPMQFSNDEDDCSWD